MKSEVKSALIFGVIIVAGIGIMSLVFSSFDEEVNSSIMPTEDNLLSKIDKSRFKQAPDLIGIAHYLNTTPEKLSEEMEGKVILYDIWTYSCINCIRTLPYITSWSDKYS
ncbi:MAG TPA: thiol-disulfide isomerase, partial [Nitrosopumilus sp.]|nr:thiol-disulfide isomerase [Nitrosopumilus sp.]